ncbi:MAG: Crp/Fnr family transcriptional regulator [Deltaproteobacteria bacterium]|nr:Crp/Fnr family transcriptional regulator [Deltaproteobacteria bacterium]
MDIVSFLRTIPLTKGLTEDQLRILARNALEKIYRAGQTIVAEDDRIRTFYIVIRGKVKMFKSSAEGKEQTLYLLGPGELFGMCATFSDSIFPANVMTMEESAILVLPGKILETLGKEDPTILFNIVFVLSRMLKESMALVETLSLMEIPQRIAAFLRFSTPKKDCNEGDVMEMEITQRELSKILGTTPETLSRVLKKMAEQEVLLVKGRNIRILDCDALEKIATG